MLTKKPIMEQLLKELQEIRRLLSLQKQVLTLEEFCLYSGIAKNQAYHLTSTGKIKFYKPFGKMIYFDLEDVREFLLQNPSITSKRRQTIINKY